MERASEDNQTQIRENVPPVDLVPPTSPSASVHQPAPPLAGHEEKKDALWEQIITPTGMFKRPSSGRIYGCLEVLKQPIIARLEELTSMDPTVEVGMEIADSVYLLNLINSANPEMRRAGLQAARGAMQLQKAADSVIYSQRILRVAIHSQQILRAALPNKDNIVNTSPNPTHDEEKFGHEEKKDALWKQIITLNGMPKRPSSGGIYGSLEVLKQPIIARLEELTSMNPTVEVGMEIADSVYLLNLINSANPEMRRAGRQAARGAKELQKAADSVIDSQQILRAALPNKDNIVNTSPNPTHDEEKFGGEKRVGEILWVEIIKSLVKFKRPSSGGIYGSLKVLKQPIIACLEELTSMDPTEEVGTEIVDSVNLLNLINSANPEMQRAGLQAARAAKRLQEAARSVIRSQQILRSWLLNKDNIGHTCLDLEAGCRYTTSDFEEDDDLEDDDLEDDDDEMYSFGDYDSEPLVNQGIYSIVNPLKGGCPLKRGGYAGGSKGTKVQSSSASGRLFKNNYDADFGPLVNQGIYSSVKSKVASGSKGTKVQSSSGSGQVPLQTEKQNH